MKPRHLWSSLCVLTAVAALTLPVTAPAWDDEGHMVVAALAYDGLTPAVKARADALLKLNPQYRSWVKGVAKADRRKTAFMKAATWPDFIKGKEANAGCTTAPHPDKCRYKRDKVDGPEASRNTGYDDKNIHAYWHYKDLPFSRDGTEVKASPTPNAETQIEAFRKVLASSKARRSLKSYDLVWLLHLVGDVHQPLHATSRFSHATPEGDQGGNLVCFGSYTDSGCKPNLHSYWDDILGTSETPADAVARAAGLPSPPADAGAVLTTATWLEQSEQLAESTVYAAPFDVAVDPHDSLALPPAEYHDAAVKVAEERASLAGARLAAVLNTELK